MKLSELKDLIDGYVQFIGEDPNVVIAIELPYSTVGATPTVPLKLVTNGFDWDKGKFILKPEENLTPADRDFADQMKRMQEDLGIAKLENRRLKSEIKKLKEQLQ
jgi:hypothetical protein